MGNTVYILFAQLPFQLRLSLSLGSRTSVKLEVYTRSSVIKALFCKKNNENRNSDLHYSPRMLRQKLLNMSRYSVNPVNSHGKNKWLTRLFIVFFHNYRFSSVSHHLWDLGLPSSWRSTRDCLSKMHCFDEGSWG